MEKDPNVGNTPKFYDMSREETMAFQWKRLRYLWDLDKDKYFLKSKYMWGFLTNGLVSNTSLTSHVDAKWSFDLHVLSKHRVARVWGTKSQVVTLSFSTQDLWMLCLDRAWSRIKRCWHWNNCNSWHENRWDHNPLTYYFFHEVLAWRHGLPIQLGYRLCSAYFLRQKLWSPANHGATQRHGYSRTTPWYRSWWHRTKVRIQ